MIVDAPESLFFAETFLRTVLPDTKLIPDGRKRCAGCAEYPGEPLIVLRPLHLREVTKKFNFDIVINTLSLGRNDPGMGGSLSQWLAEQPARIFYSSNTFGAELDRMFESWCLLSPVVPQNWVMTKYSLDHPYQAFWAEYTRRFAEIWFEKAKPGARQRVSLASALALREGSKFTVGDLIYFIYNLDAEVDAALESRIIKKFLADVPYVPKELFFWVQRVEMSRGAEALDVGDREFIQGLRSRLAAIHAAQKSNVVYAHEKKIIEPPVSMA